MKISVTLPNFNHGRFLRQAFNGFISQSYTNWEVCVVDDGSSDESWEIIEHYRNQDHRIVAERFPANRGAHVALQRCLDLCTGELLYASSADDYVSDPSFFEYVVRALERFPQAAGAYGRAVLVDGDSGRELFQMGSYVPATRDGNENNSIQGGEYAASFPMQFIPRYDACAAFLAHRMFIPGIAAIWKRALVTELGGYDKALGPQSDYFVNHALASLYGAVFIDLPAASVRAFADSYSNSAADTEYFARNALVEKRLRTLDLPYEVEESLFAQWRTALIRGRTTEDFQKRLVSSVRSICGSMQAWERQALTHEVATFVSRLTEDCAKLENELDHRIAAANRIFTEIAGPIQVTEPSEPPVPINTRDDDSLEHPQR